MVKEIAKVNGELYSMRFGENKKEKKSLQKLRNGDDRGKKSARKGRQNRDKKRTVSS